MTAIADIIVNQSSQDYAPKEKINVGFENVKPQVNFSDVLASVSKSESNEEKVNPSENNTVQNNSVKEEKSVQEASQTEEKISDVKDAPENTVNNTQESEKNVPVLKENKEQDKIPEKKEDKVSNQKTVSQDKNQKLNNVEKKSEPAEKKDSVKKLSKNEKDARKLTKDEFYRMEQLSEKNEIISDENQIFQDVQPELAAVIQNAGDNINSDVKSNPENNYSELPVVTDAKTDDSKKEIPDFSERKSDRKPVVSKFDADGKITVQDYRQKVDSEKDSGTENKNDIKHLKIKTDGQNTEVTMEIAANDAAKDTLSLNNQTAASDGSTFRAMLNNQIQANTPEFVKAGNIILKDNNQGTINLVLHPDDLGNVKIHLSMDGKTVHGQIVVNSKEALQVFKENAASLREAFINNGFDAANFDVSFNTASGQTGQNDSFDRQFNDAAYIGKKTYGALGDSEAVSADVFEQNNFDFSNYSINIVA